MRRNAGMTLVEVMTAFGLFIILFALVIATTRSLRQAFDYGDARIVLQQRARVAFARITPLLVTAVAPTNTQPAIEFPPVIESFEAPGENSLRFHSPIDFFGQQRLPTTRDPVFHRYEIQFKDNTIFLNDLERAGFPPRVLASHIDSFVVRHVQLNAVNLEVGVSLKKTRKEFRLETLVQIPYYSN